jgi:hypothetical protein
MDFNAYYDEQAGSGLPGFVGNRYQRGNGFFGRIFKSAILPLMKYLGKQAVATGADIAQDALDGQSIKESVKKRGREALTTIGTAGVKRAKHFVQTGKGRKRRKKSTKKVKSKRKSKKLKCKKRKVKRKTSIPNFFK